MYRILIIEDDQAVALGLEMAFRREEWEVVRAHSGQEGLAKCAEVESDLVILDIGLPDQTGFDVCQKIRESSNVPIVFLTARDEEIDTIRGLELGADDYVTKPVRIGALCSRIRAILRRAYGEFSHLPQPSNELEFEGLQIDLLKRKVEGKNGLIELTSKEFDLLVTMAKAPGRVFTREVLLNQIWGYRDYQDDRVVNVTIYRLREKIESDPSHPQYILTVRGAGYKFNDHLSEGDR